LKLAGPAHVILYLYTAYGLQCYICAGVKSSACTQKQTCPTGVDRCATVEQAGKSCSCNCCSTDLCNDTITTGSSVLLLLVSSAITSVFL
uniref:Uncharacterized protein n=1 Tax=Sparus aurata TaxID=8175 RepID=A0A671U751_SPAAU